MKYAKIAVMLVALTFVTVSAALSAPPNPPLNDNGKGHGPPCPHGAPVGEGLLILTMAAVAYGAHKWKYRRKLCE